MQFIQLGLLAVLEQWTCQVEYIAVVEVEVEMVQEEGIIGEETKTMIPRKIVIAQARRRKFLSHTMQESIKQIHNMILSRNT